MREILFRGKRKDNCEWVKGSFWDEIPGDLGGIAPYGSCCFHHVDLETVGQYTGLTDKNGKKAFEGDIFATKCNKGVIVFDDYYGTFGFQIWWRGFPDDYATFREFGKPEFEIIGNIHDNPELLEKK